MADIQKSDLVAISYAEFGDMLDRLTNQIIESGVKFDLVVPILRSGGMTGMHVAAKLQVENILPVQYKRVYESDVHVVNKFEMPKLTYALPAEASILVVDTNTAKGRTASRALHDLRAVYPDAQLYFASANIDIACELPVERVFYGQYGNEERTLTRDEADSRGVTNNVIVFPWESSEERWIDANA